ncbi:MAG: VWA domain-containing protein, partial [Opitutaceae bacterium]
MSLLLPAFFSAAAFVGLPLLLHLLRLQPRKQIPFPSLVFLGRDALRDSNRHRLRRWLTLLLRCLLILLVVLAFCRPFWPLEHSENSRAVVVVLDNSYSMQAAGRSAAVEAWLAPQVAALRPPDQLGVLVLHPTPIWLVPLTADLEAGRNALKKFPESYETSHYRAGL